MSAMSRQPAGAAFDLVLLLHVGCVVTGLATTVTSAAMASRLRRLTENETALPESMGRYFAPGVNWAGRAMYGIPVFGLALLAMSQGAYSLRDSWVMAGVAVFAVLALLAEGVLWPAERRLQQALVAPLAEGVPAAPSILADVRTMGWSAGACIALLVIGSGLMLAQP
jgi:hypothetical protein